MRQGDQFIRNCFKFIIIFYILSLQCLTIDQVDYFIKRISQKLSRLSANVQSNYNNFTDQCEIKTYNLCKGTAQLTTCYENFKQPSIQCLQNGQMLSSQNGIILTKNFYNKDLTDQQKHTICSGAKLQKVFRDLDKTRNKEYIWVYFSSKLGIYRMHPSEVTCEDYDGRFRPWYSKAITGKKNLVLLLDTSNAQKQYIDSIKLAARSLSKTFNTNDSISVMSINSQMKSLFDKNLVFFKPQFKEQLQKQIDNIKVQGITNLTNHFQAIMQILSEQKQNYNLCCKNNNTNDVIFVLFTNGFNQDNEQVQTIIKMMKQFTEIRIQMFIFSFDIRDINDEFLTKLSCSFNGAFYKLKSTASQVQIQSQLQIIYNFMAQNQQSSQVWSQIYQDTQLKQYTVTLAQSVYHKFTDSKGLSRSYFLGVTGIDVVLSKLFDLGMTRSQVQRRLKNTKQYKIKTPDCSHELLRKIKCGCDISQYQQIVYPKISQQIYIEDYQVEQKIQMCCGLQKKQLIGILVGSGVFLMIIVGVSVYCCCKSYKNRKQKQKKQEQANIDNKIDANTDRALMEWYKPQISSQNQLMFPMPPPQIYKN